MNIAVAVAMPSRITSLSAATTFFGLRLRAILVYFCIAIGLVIEAHVSFQWHVFKK